jgi:hypothetical protein
MAKTLRGLMVVVFMLGVGMNACSLAGDLPVCDLEAINLQSIFPSYSHAVEDLTSPMLEWRYYMEEDGSDATCDPASQHIRFGKRSFDEAGTILLDALVERDLTGMDRRYTPGMALEQAEHYFYEVTWYGEDGTVLGSRVIPFNTGPVCTRDELLPPVIISLPDGAIAEADATISWEFQGGCTPESVEADVSSSRSFASADTEIYALPYAFHGLSGWEACRYYYWRVASTMLVPPTEILYIPDVDFPYPHGAEPFEYEFSGFLRSEYTATRSFYVIGEACPIAPPDFGITPIPIETHIPIARLLEPANCRSGPSMDFPLLSILPAGNEYEIQGRNTPGDSWMVFDPSINGTCWVHGDLVEVVGDTGLVMIIDPDPPGLVLPTETAASVDCSQWSTNQNACVANPACTWQPNLHPTSPCVNK